MSEEIDIEQLERDFVEASPSLQKLLSTTLIKEVANLTPVICIPITATLEEALKILADNNILAAPLYDKTNGKYQGMVDMLDLLTVVVKHYVETHTVHTGKGTLQWQTWLHDAHKLVLQSSVISHYPVAKMADASNLDPYCTVNMNKPLNQLLFMFKTALHRCMVVDDDDKAVGIISQSDVVRYIAKNINQLDPVTANTSLASAGLSIKKCVLVHGGAKAIHAFNMMRENAVSGVAVVSKEGLLLANLSASDLRGLKQQDFVKLNMPVLQFIKECCPKRKIPPVTCTDTTTLETLVLKFAATGVHRIWCVDEWQKPVGVISLSDFMLLLDLRLYSHQTEEALKQRVPVISF